MADLLQNITVKANSTAANSELVARAVSLRRVRTLGAALSAMPCQEQIFPAQLAWVAHERELEIAPGQRETVDAFFATALGLDSTGPLQCQDAVGRDGPSSPTIAFAVLIEINIEGTVILHYPNCAERVCPGADEHGLHWLLEHGACAERECARGRDDFQGRACPHIANPACRRCPSQAQTA